MKSISPEDWKRLMGLRDDAISACDILRAAGHLDLSDRLCLGVGFATGMLVRDHAPPATPIAKSFSEEISEL